VNSCIRVNVTDSKAVALNEAIKADHGFHSESRAIRELVGIMSDFDAFARRDFLQFITGSPKLPIGGVFHFSSS
jgi:E3 ubiquitin-protein ligase TRIP12